MMRTDSREEDVLPEDFEAQREAYRRLHEERIHLRDANRRLQHDVTHLHETVRHIEDLYAEAMKVNQEQYQRLAQLGEMGFCDDAPPRVPSDARCRICYGQSISHVIVPCGHAVTCEECSLTLSNTCCVCRGPIEKVIRLYFG